MSVTEPDANGVRIASPDDLVEMLTASDEVSRIMGRAVAAELMHKQMEWLQAEVRRGTDYNLLVQAYAGLLVSCFASFIGNTAGPVDPEVAGKAEALLTEAVRVGFQPTFDGVLAALARRRGARP